MGKTAIIIPARYGSSRLEGKPLIKVLDKPIIQWVWEKAKKCANADMVIVATDASANTKKLFYDKCSFYEVPCFEYGTKVSLGHAIGKEMRASVAILDGGFAKSIIKHLESLDK